MPFVVDQQGRKLQEKDILKECRQRQLESLPPLLDQHGRSLCGGSGGDEPVPNEIDDTNRRKLRYNCAEVNCRDAVFCRRQLAADAGLAPDPVITADAAAVVDVATATSSPAAAASLTLEGRRKLQDCFAFEFCCIGGEHTHRPHGHSPHSLQYNLNRVRGTRLW